MEYTEIDTEKIKDIKEINESDIYHTGGSESSVKSGDISYLIEVIELYSEVIEGRVKEAVHLEEQNSQLAKDLNAAISSTSFYMDEMKKFEKMYNDLKYKDVFNKGDESE